MAEFDLIARYFTRPAHADVGVGDDAALVTIQPGCQLVVSADMSVSGTHFFADADPYAIGWKSMAVNVSDMAAMGAQPRWATLSIALPSIAHDWLAAFSQGLFDCAEAFSVSLIGGDTTRGPLNIAITILGEVPRGLAITRAGAQAGDDVWVSGCLGQAALWLGHQQAQLCLHELDVAEMARAMHHPQPRVRLGLALRGLASAALDVSDGLLADLSHILKASGVGAELNWQALPCPQLQRALPASSMTKAVLAGGDDYELCFTASPTHRSALATLSQQLQLPLSRIGHITAQQGLIVLDNGQPMALNEKGYQHFV